MRKVVSSDVVKKNLANEESRQFNDKRHDFVAQSELQKCAHKSPQVKQLRIFQKVINAAGVTGIKGPVSAVSSIVEVPQKKSNSSSLDIFQRALDENKIDRYKQILGLNSVSVVEMPNDKQIKVTSSFSTYPAPNVYNLSGDLADRSLLNIEFLKTDEQVKREFGNEAYNYYDNTSAYSYLKDFQGGGAYVSTSKLVVICQGEADRALMHEMGHAEQHERLDARMGGTETTTNQVILEYHNFILNENQYDLVETEKPLEEIDMRTFYNRSNTGKHKDKNWGDLCADAKNRFPLNERLLQEIKIVLDSKVYAPWAKKTAHNLISEYYESIAGK